ncbi:MAG: molybdopterin-dependent oxidoreductase [Desulfobacterales bacterium]|nr:molybdopterin-dependent oxidoreductase [Desulfobacterales bacterium]
MKKTETISTICRMCDHGCGIEVGVAEGQPVSLKGAREHPYNKGWLCAKGRAALDFFHHPKRLATPLIKKEGKFVSVDWNRSLDFAAKTLNRLRDQYGPASLAIYHGEGVGHQEIKYYMKRFANVYGTPNFMGVGSLCNASRTIAEALTIGGLTKPDIPNTRFLIIWGGNPLISNEPFTPGEISRLKKRGGKLVVIDPRETETASKADIHLPIRPGYDEILILNMLHVILREELWDKAFTAEWVNGFNNLFETVSADRFSPENGQAGTGISPDLTRQVVRAYARTKPAGIFTGNGLEHQSFGVQTMRLLAILKAITGNLDVPGGDLFTPRPRLNDMTAPLPEPSIPPIGSETFPLFCQARKEAHALSLAGAILNERPYPIKAMIIAGGNPTLEWPNSHRTRQAFQKLEFLMLIDVVRPPDSQYADVILPACTFLERDEHRVNVYQNLPYITLRRKVVEPVHGLPDQMIWVRLAHHMGFGEYFPWQSCEEGIDYLLEELGITYRDLISKGGIYEYEKRRYKKYEKNGFPTATGKIELYPEQLENFGFDPSPVRKNAGKPVGYGDKFPLILTTGGNLLCYTHWQFRYISKLRKISPEPTFEVHPTTANQYGISEGEMAEVRSPFGKILLKACLTRKMLPDTIHISQGWEEANVNELTGTENADPVSGFPNLKSIRCNIQKLS